MPGSLVVIRGANSVLSPIIHIDQPTALNSNSDQSVILLLLTSDSSSAFFNWPGGMEGYTQVAILETKPAIAVTACPRRVNGPTVFAGAIRKAQNRLIQPRKRRGESAEARMKANAHTSRGHPVTRMKLLLLLARYWAIAMMMMVGPFFLGDRMPRLRVRLLLQSLKQAS